LQHECGAPFSENPAAFGALCYAGSSLLMRWLMICLLVCLAVLLIAAAGMVGHIRRQRAKLRSSPSAAFEPAEESELELER